MTDADYKPGARCRFYPQCAIYNLGLLREEAELTLCGNGQTIQKDYIPRIQDVHTPPSREAGSPGEMAVCPAFVGMIESLLTGTIRAYIEQIDQFWQRRRDLDDIFDE